MANVIGCVFGLVSAFFFVAFLVSWFRSREQVRSHKRLGIAAGICFVVLELLILLLAGSEARQSLPILQTILVDGVAFVRIAAFTIVGVHMCRGLGYHSFPLLKPRLGVVEASKHDPLEDEQLDATELVETEPNAEPTETDDTSLPSSEVDYPTSLPVVRGKQYALLVIGVGLGAIVYSAILFWLTSPRISDMAQQIFGEGVVEINGRALLLWLFVSLDFALVEEITFRLGIQNYVAKQLNWQGNRYWLAIILSAAFWTLGHSGVMEPDWVKLLQIFPIGLALGWLFRKVGTEGCILAHALFNVVFGILTPFVLGWG